MNIRKQDILNCLPLLASVLGSQYGVKVEIGGGQACTDGKVIHIPAMPADCDTEIIAAVRGFIDHESAHIRYTDFDELKSFFLEKSAMFFWNAIEDWRVEKKLSEIYPGCRQNLNWLIRNYLLNDSKETNAQKPAFLVLNYVLLTVRSWDVPEISQYCDKIKEALKVSVPGLTDRLDKILLKVRKNCPDTHAAMVYAKMLERCLQLWQPPVNMQTKQKDSHSSNSNAVSEDNQYVNSSIKERKQNELNEKGYGGGYIGIPKNENKANPQSAQNSAVNKDDNKSSYSVNGEIAEAESVCENGKVNSQVSSEELAKQLNDLFTNSTEELPQSIGDMLASKLNKASVPFSENRIEAAIEMPMRISPLDYNEKLAAMRSSIALRQKLQGLLQARTLKQCVIGRRGNPHTSSLYRLSIGNPKIFQKKGIAQGVNTAVHILLDCSLSMAGKRIEVARQACYAIAGCLDNIKGVNLAVTAFPANGGSTVSPIIRHGERVSDQFGIKANGGTPLAEGIWWVLQTMMPLQEKRKIVLIITDGDPNNYDASVTALEYLDKFGFEVYGIGIDLQLIENLLPGRNRVINHLSELAPALFEILRDALLRGKNK